jgi:hypothetical protein
MPQDEAPLDDFLDPDAETKRRALLDPCPSWSDWFLFSGAKPWVGLCFLVVDVWIGTTWLIPLNLAAMGLSLVAAVYLEFMAYRYLWYRPDEIRVGERFRPTWRVPRQFGLWTPEERARRLGELVSTPTGPDPREFL